MKPSRRRTAPGVRHGRVQKKNNHTYTASYWNQRQPELVIDRERPGRDHRHLLLKRDVEQFVALIPAWNELSQGLNAVVLAEADGWCDGWYSHRGFGQQQSTGLLAALRGPVCEFTQRGAMVSRWERVMVAEPRPGERVRHARRVGVLVGLVMAAAAWSCGTTNKRSESDWSGLGGGGVGGLGAGGSMGQCPTGLIACGLECVDPFTNSLHCGHCDNPCTPGSSCQGASCVCQTGFTDCGAGCVDLMSDAYNCGACSEICSVGDVCASGQCTDSCPVGTQQCENSCVDVASSPLHCGACNTPCAGGQVCLGGTCTDVPGGLVCNDGVCTCPPGQTLCEGECVDVLTNPDHCGDCGVACRDPVCAGGTCSCACPAGLTCCSTSDPTRPACVDVTTDSSHCGGCDLSCPAGQVCVDAVCAAGP